MKPKQRSKGDSYRPIIQVLKAKNGTPTRISLNGHQYALVHPDYINGYKSKVSN